MRGLFITFLSLLLFTGCRTKDVTDTETEFKMPFHSWAPTPPMGWNSWDCYGPTVTEAEVKANADYMAKNLREKNTPIQGSGASAQDIYSPDDQCPWLKDMYTIVAGKEGAQEYYNSILKLYTSWEVDFVKVDDLSGHLDEIEMVRKAIDNCGRPIVLSLSPSGNKVEDADFLRDNANMWRTTGDFWDNWPDLKDEFEVCNRWSASGGPGYYPDADMLPLGRIGIRAERGEPRWSLFTKDEQYTLMTLFAIFRSPLMFGGDLPSNDEFTLSLITNREVLNVNQNSRNGKQLFGENDLIAWTADDPATGDKYLALFNASDKPGETTISVSFEQVGLKGAVTVTDLWSGVKTGKFRNNFSAQINSHGAGLYRIH